MARPEGPRGGSERVERGAGVADAASVGERVAVGASRLDDDAPAERTGGLGLSPSTDTKAAGSPPGCPAARDAGGDVPGVMPGDEVGGHRAAAEHVLDLLADDARHRAPAEALAERGAECLVEVEGERAGEPARSSLWHSAHRPSPVNRRLPCGLFYLSDSPPTQRASPPVIPPP